MNDTPSVHVIIPVYNCEKYVAEAIESVLNQPYKNINIVLINDGSTDSSPKICDQYAENNDRVHVIHQANGGVSSARNAGIEYVLNEVPETKYIAFLDADDKWIDGFYAEEIFDLLSCGYDLIGFQTARCNNSVTRYSLSTKMQEGIHQGGVKSVWLNSKQTFGAAFYATSVLKMYGIRFLDGLKINEDLIFSMQFKYLADSIYLCNKLLYLYRNNITSASHKKVDAIQKYEPIINAYIASDELMSTYQNTQRGILKEGHAMAAVYIVDVHEEHYQQLGAKKDLNQMMQRNAQYMKLITSQFAYNRPDSGLRWQKMMAHPLCFRLKCYVKGTVLSGMRNVYLNLMKISAIAKMIEKKRYPLEL